MKTKFIKEFKFKKATYQVADENSVVILKVDYKNNCFDVATDSKIDTKFKKEIQKIARDLLKRKHGVNFAER